MDQTKEFFKEAGAQNFCITPYEASLNDRPATDRESVFPVH
jgi:hypothetical protein